MRRRLTALGAAVLVTLTIAGCGNPAGVDGDLFNGWAAFPEPAGIVPAAGQCHEFTSSDEVRVGDHQPRDCAAGYRTETVHVGEFADAPTKPPAGGPAMRTAYRECDAKARDYLGGDWRVARLQMRLRTPTSAAWLGGARWFRCDVHEVKALDNQVEVRRTASLKSVLAGKSDLLLGCYKGSTMPDGSIDSMAALPCDKPHQSEFVGIHTANHGTYAALVKDRSGIHQGCLRVIASYAKLPVDDQLKYRAGTVVYKPEESEWMAGDRGVRCLLWNDKPLTRSIRGGGTKVLPT